MPWTNITIRGIGTGSWGRRALARFLFGLDFLGLDAIYVPRHLRNMSYRLYVVNKLYLKLYNATRFLFGFFTFKAYIQPWRAARFVRNIFSQGL